MVSLSIPPVLNWGDICLNLVPPELFLESLFYCGGNLLLLIILCENCRPVLSTHIGALSVSSSGIVNSEEEVNNRFIREVHRVKQNLQCFSMVRGRSAYFSIGGVRLVASRIADRCVNETLIEVSLAINMFYTPKTASCNSGNLQIGLLFQLVEKLRGNNCHFDAEISVYVYFSTSDYHRFDHCVTSPHVHHPGS